MDTNSLELVKEFAEKIEVLGGNLFEIALKQQMVHVTSSLLGIGFLCLIMMVGYRIYIKERDKCVTDDDKLGLLIIGAVIFLVISIISFFVLQILIQWLLNPEYAAIGEVMKLVNAAT